MEKSLSFSKLSFPLLVALVFSLGVAVVGWKLIEFASGSSFAGQWAGVAVFFISMLTCRFIVRGMSPEIRS